MYVRLCLSLSILPFHSLKVGGHFDMHHGYIQMCTIIILENEANTQLHFAMSSLGALQLSRVYVCVCVRSNLHSCQASHILEDYPANLSTVARSAEELYCPAIS